MSGAVRVGMSSCYEGEGAPDMRRGITINQRLVQSRAYHQQRYPTPFPRKNVVETPSQIGCVSPNKKEHGFQTLKGRSMLFGFYLLHHRYPTPLDAKKERDVDPAWRSVDVSHMM